MYVLCIDNYLQTLKLQLGLRLDVLETFWLGILNHYDIAFDKILGFFNTII